MKLKKLLQNLKQLRRKQEVVPPESSLESFLSLEQLEDSSSGKASKTKVEKVKVENPTCTPDSLITSLSEPILYVLTLNITFKKEEYLNDK